MKKLNVCFLIVFFGGIMLANAQFNLPTNYDENMKMDAISEEYGLDNPFTVIDDAMKLDIYQTQYQEFIQTPAEKGAVLAGLLYYPFAGFVVTGNKVIDDDAYSKAKSEYITNHTVEIQEVFDTVSRPHSLVLSISL